MKTFYTLKNGCRLETFMWEEMLRNETYRGTTEVIPIYGERRGRKCNKKLYSDDRGIYIIWNGENVYLNEYDYMSAEELIEKLEEGKKRGDRWCVYDDEICETFLRETDKIGVVLDMPVFEVVVPQLGIGLTGSTEVSVLCIPTEKHYTQSRWSYKFTLECENEELRRYIPSRDFYFSDFCSFLKSGIAQLVIKDEFKKETEEKYAEREERKNTIRYKIAKIFGRNENEEKLTLIGIENG